MFNEYNDYLLCGVKKTKRLTFNELFIYWREQLIMRIMAIFNYKNLPVSLPKKEIEFRLITRGFCGVNKVGGELKAVFCSLFGVTDYEDIFKAYTWTTPLHSGICKIGVDGILIEANQTRTPLIRLVFRYAVLLAHADLSLQAILINSRATGIFSAKDDKQAESIKTWYDTLSNGNLCAIVNDELLSTVIGQEGLRNIATNYPDAKNISDFYEIHRNILKDFYNDLGVKFSTEKKERLITAEVESAEESLLLNIDDMLNTRKEGVANINKLFGTNIEVELNAGFVRNTEKDDSEN